MNNNCKRQILISYIIPAKNEDKNIEACIEAIKSQYQNTTEYEIIVVDNGSVDTTVRLAEGLGARVFVRPDYSISGLRNCGARSSQGKFLAFIDADVVVDKFWHKFALDAIDKVDVGMVGASPRIPNGATWVENVWHHQIRIRPERYRKEWLASMNILVRREAFDAVGGFSENLLTCEDVDFGYKISKKYKVIYDKKIGAVHYGEAKTLKRLFFKEVWRAKSNYSGFINHGLVLREIPSLLMPIINLIGIGTFFTGILMANLLLIGLGFALICIFPLLKSIVISWGMHSFADFFKLFVVWGVYAAARSVSAVLEFRRVCLR